METTKLLITSIPESDFGVHQTHCCLRHGCKYGDRDCPVELGLIKQTYGCEYGREEERDCFKTEIQEQNDKWDEAYKKADHYLTTEDPLGKVCGYNHTQLIEYLKKHYNISKK